MSSDNSTSTTFPRKLQDDGTPNTKYVDVLDEDKPIANQKFTCVSFVSPESTLKSKNLFFFEGFLGEYELSKSMEKYHQFLNFLAYKYNLSTETLIEDFKGFAKDEIDSLKETTVDSDYKNFVDAKEDQLDAEFLRAHEFQTSVRGLKVRGVYPTLEEAELRCKMLREMDPNHDVYVGPIGMWMPWEPDAYKTGRVEYLEDELNKLMQEKVKNQDFAKMAFDKRVKDTKKDAIRDNVEKAELFNTTLTQDVDEDGNLISVGGINSQEAVLGGSKEEVAVGDIRSELFEGDNIVTDVNTDRGLSSIENTHTKMGGGDTKTSAV
jgi:hypothetical protein